MTNTGDFRRYSYATDASYALKAFDVQRSSVAPAYAPERKRQLKVREGDAKKSAAQLRKEQKVTLRMIVQITVVAGLCLAMFFGALVTHAQKNELTHQVSRLETKLDIAKSENTRITSELDALVSMSMIDRYAVEELGMTKMKSNQIRYIDVSQYKEHHFNAVEKLLQETEK